MTSHRNLVLKVLVKTLQYLGQKVKGQLKVHLQFTKTARPSNESLNVTHSLTTDGNLGSSSSFTAYSVNSLLLPRIRKRQLAAL